jgi:iron complex outermembrane receptor protein
MYLYPVGFETTIRGVFPVWEFRQTNALLSGIDVSGAWDLHQNWRYSIQGSWLYGWDDTQKEYLIDIPPPNLTQKLGFTHPGWHRLTIELSHQLVAGQTRYPNANFDTNIVVDGQLVPVTVDISTPPPGYGLWSYYSEMTFDAGSNRSLIIGLGMMNLTNKSYRNYLNRQRFYADEAGRNVMLQIRLTF